VLRSAGRIHYLPLCGKGTTLHQRFQENPIISRFPLKVVNQFAQFWKSVSGYLRKGALIVHKVLYILDLTRILNGSRIAHSRETINLVGMNYFSGVSTLLACNSQRASLSGILILAGLFWGSVLYAQSNQSVPPTTQGNQITGSKSGERAPSSSKKRGKTHAEDGNSSNESGAEKTAGDGRHLQDWNW